MADDLKVSFVVKIIAIFKQKWFTVTCGSMSTTLKKNPLNF